MKPALLIDLDDTLIVEGQAAAAAFAATARFAAVVHDLDPAALTAAVRTRARELFRGFELYPYCDRVGISSSEAMWCRFDGDGEETAALRAWMPEYRREAWARALADQGVVDGGLAEELGDLFGRERRRRHANEPGAEACLRELRATHALALVTNGASSLQREKLEASGLEPCFDAVIVSGELGTGKPDPAIFHHALEQLDHDGAQAVMVGDNLRRDVEGALAAGLRAVWVDREGAGGAPEGVPAIRTIAELPTTLRA